MLSREVLEYVQGLRFFMGVPEERAVELFQENCRNWAAPDRRRFPWAVVGNILGGFRPLSSGDSQRSDCNGGQSHRQLLPILSPIFAAIEPTAVGSRVDPVRVSRVPFKRHHHVLSVFA